MLATTIYASARWNSPAAIGTPAGCAGAIGTPASLPTGHRLSSLADVFRGDAGNDVLYSGGGADRCAYQGPGFGDDEIAGFTKGQARLDFTASDIGLAGLFLRLANGNCQVGVFGSAILVFGVASLGAADFIF